MNLPDLDELTGESATKSRMKMDWEVDGAVAVYHLSEASSTYEVTEKYATPGRVDRAINRFTEGDDIPEILGMRGKSWSETLYEVTEEMLDDQVEELVFDHGETYRVMKDPTPESAAAEAYIHLARTIKMDPSFRTEADMQLTADYFPETTAD
ncbi:hypothetical protein ACK3SF_02230 [Candidatus Nanosalina sp. VS9-1]|uniref:hypothetical protein n=1 Tax=Candidatus Nanosalina sp. VS9-1 TaxID=3388566 RepID=UPI0039DFFFE9